MTKSAGRRMPRMMLSVAVGWMAAACAVAPPPRSYPERPFYDDRIARLDPGLPADTIVAWFGRPDTTYEMTFGKKAGDEWKGVAYRYYAAKDPAYRFVDAWKKNTFYFWSSPDGLLLNHWVIEHLARASQK